HGEYTMYGHFFFLKRLLGNVQKWRFFIDQDPGLRAACLAAFHDEIRGRAADVFYVRINKGLTVDERRHRYNDAKAVFEQVKASHPGMKPQEVKRELIKERLAVMTAHGKWQDRWLDHPFPTMGEPEKAVAYLTDLGDYDEDHKAWLYNKASLHGVDCFLTKCADGSPCSNDRSTPSPTRAGSGTVTHRTTRGMLPRCLISCAQSTTTF
ncbi:MAG: hypothetical protein WBN81_10025, partial [Gammaproteobacteria bacterium]